MNLAVFGISLHLALVPVIGGDRLAVSPPARAAAAELTMADLQSLAGLGTFETMVGGQAQVAYPTGRTCVYFETLYGEKVPGGWAHYRYAGATDEPVRFSTPKGALVLPPNKLRLHLAPTFSQIFTPNRAHLAPAFVQDDLEEEGRPLTVESFCLEPGRPYYAKVEREAFYLPPERGATRPSVRHAYVLVVSDEPFVDGKPPNALTPRGKEQTY